MSSSRGSLKKMDSVSGSVNSLTSTNILRESSETDAETSNDPKFLQQQLREEKDEKEKAIAKCEQVNKQNNTYVL